jgi:peroxiredoxin
LPSTIEQVHREYKDLGLALYAVNIEESRTTVAGFVRKHGMAVPVLLDPDGDASAAYHITATPTVFLIGRDGKLVAKALGTKSWTSPQGRALLQRLLAK